VILDAAFEITGVPEASRLLRVQSQLRLNADPGNPVAHQDVDSLAVVGQGWSVECFSVFLSILTNKL